MCGLFGKTRQAYYQKQEYEYRKSAEEDLILDLVCTIRKDIGHLGGRKLWYMLNHQLSSSGLSIGRDALFDLLRKEGLLVKQRKQRVRTTYSAHWMHKWRNQIKDFTPTSSNELWVSDITYIETASGWSYLHLVTDAYSKKIMGWCVSPTLESKYTIQALKMAIRNAKGQIKDLIHHSDRGCQYCCD